MLHHALRLSRPPLVQRLLREGAYPARSGERHPPPERSRLDAVAAAHGFAEEAATHMRRALRAAAARDDPRAARGLLLHGCEPDSALLYTLVRTRRAPRVAIALLAAGADANYADGLGTHLLALVTLQGDVGMAKALLAAGADPLVEEDDGQKKQTILELARSQAAVPEMLEVMEEAVARRAGGNRGGKASAKARSGKQRPQKQKQLPRRPGSCDI